MKGCNCFICVSRRKNNLPEIPYSNDLKIQAEYLKKLETVEAKQIKEVNTK